MSLELTVRSQAFEGAARAFVAGKLSPHTRRAYGADIDRWLRFCYAMGVRPEMATLEVSALFREHLLVSMSNVSTRRVLSALSALYRALHKSGLVSVNPFHSGLLAWPPDSTVGKTQAVDESVAKAMIEDALQDVDRLRGLRDAVVLSLLYDTGLRRSSVASITRAAMQDDGEVIQFRTIVKGAKEAKVYLPKTTSLLVRRWLAIAPDSPYLFPSLTKKGPMEVSTVNRIVALRAKAVGAGEIHPHCFRAAYATFAYDQGIPERDIQESMHHSDPKTTRRYDRGERGLDVPEKLARIRGR